MCGWGPGYEYVEKLNRLKEIVEEAGKMKGGKEASSETVGFTRP